MSAQEIQEKHHSYTSPSAPPVRGNSGLVKRGIPHPPQQRSLAKPTT